MSLRLSVCYNRSNMTQPIIRIADDLKYQANSVVSREIARKPTGTVTLFAFDLGQGLSEHTAPFDALVHVVDGTADIFVDGEVHRLGAGELIVMPAGHPHALQAVTPFKMVLTMIRQPTVNLGAK
jgi:quercetin dioxygenase-like cupin family protein